MWFLHFLLLLFLNQKNTNIASANQPKQCLYLRCVRTAFQKRIAHNLHTQLLACAIMAGAEGLEPSTYGFGDRRSTN